MCCLKCSVKLYSKKVVWNRVEYYVRLIISYMLNFVASWYRICKLLWWVVSLKQCFWKIICLIKRRDCLSKKKMVSKTWIFEKRFLPYIRISTFPFFKVNSLQLFLQLSPKSIGTVNYFVAILSTLKTFTATLQTASFCYYYVQAGKIYSFKLKLFW